MYVAATLDKKGATVTCLKEPENVDLHRYEEKRLHIRQILLGHTAKENEYNVVEVSMLKRRY